MHDLANIRRNGAQQIPNLEVRCDATGQIQKQLEPVILPLRRSEIQAVIQRERDDTPDQPQETYFLIAKWIHWVANEAENTQWAVWCRQWYAHPRADAHLLRPGPEAWIPFFFFPIGSMLRVTTTHSIPQGEPLFHRQFRNR